LITRREKEERRREKEKVDKGRREKRERG